jgi:multidrug efflux pump subunit AcrA (membrane-fusion protein)
MKTTAHFLIFFSLLHLFAWAAPEPTSKVPVVFVETATPMVLSDELTYPARIIPKVEANVLAEGDGVVSQIHYPLGRAVKRGAPILTIRNTDPVYQYAPLRAIAPVSGVISSVDVTEGSWVSKGQKLATVVDPQQIKIAIEVSGDDLAAVTHGLGGKLVLPGREEPVDVKVVGASPFVDPASGTATCELAIASKPGTLPVRPGLVGKVSFRVKEHKGIQIPEMAVVYRGDNTFLRVIEGDRAKFVAVTLGDMRRGKVEVLKGIPDGTTYVLRASTFVGDGDPVKVQKAEAEKAGAKTP